MKIVMINTVCGVGSTGRMCTDLAEILEQHGHEVKIAYGRMVVPEQFQKYTKKIGGMLDQSIHGVKARLEDGAGFGSVCVTKKFVGWLKEYNPDVIHLHNIHGYYINVPILFEYLRNCGKKIIWTLHDCWAFTGHCAFFGAVKCENWKEGCGSCRQLKEYPKSYVDRTSVNWKRKKDCFTGIPNMQLVTPSKWLAELVRNSFLAEYPVDVINNGIDTTQFYPFESEFKKKMGLENKFLLLGVASVWDYRKGLTDFVRMAERIDDDCKIVLVGVDEKQIASLPKNIIGLQKTNSVQALVEIYNGCDLFLNLTYDDNYPTVNLEALACNTPVLTYNTGGSPESITEKNGCVVQLGDLDEVLKYVRNYQDKLKTSGERSQLLEHREVFDRKYVAKQYLALIEKMVEE